MYMLLSFFLIVFSVGWVLILKEVIQSLITWFKDYRRTQSPPVKLPATQKNREIIYN